MKVISYSHEVTHERGYCRERRFFLQVSVGHGYEERRLCVKQTAPVDVPVEVIKRKLLDEVLASLREELLKQL